MEETVLSWTVPNWLTVLLMVFLGFAIMGLGAKLLSNIGGAKNA